MLTDQEMLKVAENFLKRMVKKGIETMIYADAIIKKPYGNIYRYNTKEFILTGDFNKSLVGGGPFLVEKETGRVVSLGTMYSLEDRIKAYENGTMTTALDTYWYPDEDRFDYK
ncbi:hypothetical protein [Chryseobacterium sp.]|jgi:hypothetical protein|uniref:hypothetical protein n=1 Tax=Chryseobacterium sp. TaxID=1871047 RepID=UPI00283F6E94|nr:hypothetical protein [Chryseobacterium sp.]MDR3024041.1 hypothetical protein [Chryseobacterium sp.]